MDLHLDLDTVPGRSKRARLETALREAVRAGRLAPRTRLPATRALCVELGVSRGVVVDAYAQLAAEGYLRTRRGGGTTVAELASFSTSDQALEAPRAAVRHDLNPFTPAVAEFPRAAWSGALTQVLRSIPDARLGLVDPAGTRELRIVLASYLARARGVRTSPERIVISAGTRHAIGLLWAALAQRGSSAIAIEQPGWSGTRETAIDAGLEAVGLPVDDQGVDVQRLAAVPDVDAVAVAPAHQFPTGAVLSAARRRELVAWARQRDGRLIVEDDYDAEYRYDRHPIGCLQGVAPEHVAYAGSTSKTLSPALQIGWLVVPQALSGPVIEAARRRGGTSSPILQLAMAQLIERGDLDRHLRRQRRRYQERRGALLNALAARLPALRVAGVSAGLFAVLELPPGLDETAVAANAADRGVRVAVRGTSPGALVLGYANLAPAAAVGVVNEIAAAVEATRS